MDAITIGPIPKEMIEPKSVPRIMAKNSNCSKALFERPKRGILAKMKKAPRITRVHLSFTLKPNFFSSGFFTSGI